MPALDRHFVDAHGCRQIPCCDSIRFEQCYLLGAGSARRFAGDDLRQAPARRSIATRLLPNAWMRSPASILDCSIESTTILFARPTAAASSSRFCGQFAPMALMCMPGVSHAPSSTTFVAEVAVIMMSAPFTASSPEFTGSTVNADSLAHFAAKLFAALGIASEGANALEAPHGGDGFELRSRLVSGADDACGPRICIGEIFCRDAAGRAGAKLAQRIGLDQRRHFARRRPEKRHDETRDASHHRIKFHADISPNGSPAAM